MSTTTRIYDDTSSVLKYAGTWFRPGTWSASNGQSGTLASTNEQGATVSFVFPVAATGFRFYGIKRSRGAAYGICVDCNPNNPQYTFVDGFDASDNGANPPTALYHQSWSSPGVHTITIINQADRRGTPAGNSQLTLDRFELDVPVAAQSTVVIQRPPNTVVSTVVQTQVQQTTVVTGGGGGSNNPPSTQVTTQNGGVVTIIVTQSITTGSGSSSPPAIAASSTPTSVSSASVSTAQQQTGSSSAAPIQNTAAVDIAGSSSKSTPIGAIIGGVVGGLAVIAILILLFFWFKKKRENASSTAVATHVPVPEMRNTTTPDASTATASQTSPRGGWVTGYGYGANEKGNRHRVEQSYSSHPSDNNTSNTALLSSSPVPPPGSTSSYSHSHSLSNDDYPGASDGPRRARALDAGPVPRHLRYEDDTETLPPEYGQLFSNRSSGRASHAGQQAQRSPLPPLPSSLPPTSPVLSEPALSSPAATVATFTTSATTNFALSPNRSSQPFQPVRRT